jgi:hypothetical protein
MAPRKPAEKPAETCEHPNPVWNNGMTICPDCGVHLS